RGMAGPDHPLADGRREQSAGAREDSRPVVPELAAAFLRSPEEHRSRLPALQQVLQPVVLGERSLSGSRPVPGPPRRSARSGRSATDPEAPDDDRAANDREIRGARAQLLAGPG